MLKFQIFLGNRMYFPNTSNYKEFYDIYLGIAVREQLDLVSLTKGDLNSFIFPCLKFYKKLLNKIFEKLDFVDSFLQIIDIIDPRIIICKKYSSIVHLSKLSSNLVTPNELQNYDNEFRELRNFDMENFNIKNVETFWVQLSKIKTEVGELKFPLLPKFVLNVLCVPNSSANVERIFPQINLNKTKIRNLLKVDTRNGILYAKDLLKFQNVPGQCYKFEPSDEAPSIRYKKLNLKQMAIGRGHNDEEIGRSRKRSC